MTTTKLDEFTRAYITVALWSSHDDWSDSFLDEDHDIDSLAPETLEAISADCARFQEENRADLESAESKHAEGLWSLPKGASCTVREYAGHDFWLTRGDAGCGFWDGDWPLFIGERLDESAKRFGERDLYIGDDGLIYQV